jgi:hypothetical protein
MSRGTHMDEESSIGDRRGSETNNPQGEDTTEAEEPTKATKADEAEADVREWDLRLVAGFPRFGAELQHGEAAVVLRSFILRAWKRRQTQGFFSWLHQQPEYQSVGLDLMGYIVEPEQLCNPQCGDDSGQLHCQYRWAQMGRAVYCSWWEDRDGRHFKDLARARDAITRLANSEWWEWSDGSAPAHWRWPKWFRETIQDGLPVWFKEAPKQWT